MAGRFERAPLIYVTARVRTTDLPELTSDQRAAIEQCMIRQGLPALARPSSQQSQAGSGNSQPDIRRAFFNGDRTECLLIDSDAFEFRATDYTKYDEFIARFAVVFNALVASLDRAYGDVVSQELVLSYSDLVVPGPGRQLKDYFADDGRILPLGAISNQRGEQEHRLGQVQVTRITSPVERIDLSVEQLPCQDGKLQRCLPLLMVEHNEALTMPLSLNVPDSITAEDYAILLTQAAKISRFKLKEVDLEGVFESLHQITSETFWSLLHEDVCKQDWLYQAD